MSKKPTDITGKRFGKLVAIQRLKTNNRVRWLCKCDCGKESTPLFTNLNRGFSKSCGCDKRWGITKNTGFPSLVWSNIVHGAKKRGIFLDITPEYLWDLIIQQDFKCNLTGVAIHTKTGKNITASLDRIDSSKGYVSGNVQWVHKNVNRMKGTFSQDDFVQICKMVASKQESILTNLKPMDKIRY